MARVLIVDDDPVVSLTLARMLQSAGHEVDRAGSGLEGLGQASAMVPDVILLDMRMPGMGGLDFLRQLRRTPELRHLPVGIVTGDYFLDEQVLAELDALGATVCYKPIWLDDLKSLLASLLASRRAVTDG